jgi:hypothetical protein
MEMVEKQSYAEVVRYRLEEIRQIDEEIKEITDKCREEFRREFIKEVRQRTDKIDKKRFNRFHRVVMDSIVEEYMSIDEVSKHLFNISPTPEIRNQISDVFKWAMKCETVSQEGNRFKTIPGRWIPSWPRESKYRLEPDFDNFEDRCNYY